MSRLGKSPQAKPDQTPDAIGFLKSGLNRAARIGVERIHRVAGCHEESVIFSATKTHIGTTLWQMDVAYRSTVLRKHTNAVDFFRISPEGSIAAPAAP